jgi:hypothetical protein
MADEYNHQTTTNELRKDVHEAHSDSKVAKMLSTLALIGAVIALTLSIMALNKAGDAQSTANRATDAVERMQ